MAEGGQVPSRSILGGSDVDFEFTCSPCGEDNVREEAVKYCPECQEYMCTRCANHHGRQKVSKSHKLVKTSEVKHGHAVVKATKCLYHADRNVEMYCGEHDMVYCAKCIATDHRSCSGVVGVEDIKPSMDIHDEVKHLQLEVREFQEQLAAADKMKRSNLEGLEDQRAKVLESIETVEQDLIAHIRKISAQTAATVEKHYSNVKNELESDVKEIDTVTKEVERVTKQLKTFTNMDTHQQFVHIKLIKSSVNSGKKIIEGKSKGEQDLSFMASIDLDNLIKSSVSLGKVEINVVGNKAARVYKVKSQNEKIIKMSNDKQTCLVTGICQLPDGTVLLADCDNKKVKRLDSNYNIRDHCDLDAYPTGICCTDPYEVAVKMINNTVQFISVGTSMTKSKQIAIEGGRIWGMSYWDGSLWVSIGRGVNIYSTSGTLLKSINKGKDSQDIFKGCVRCMSVISNIMVVADNSDGAVCLNKDGVIQRELRDGEFKNCRGVTVSEEGTVFLSGYNSHNIMMFRQDGTCLGELVAKNDGLVHPLSIYFDNKRKCLMVYSYKSDKLHICMLY